MYINIVSHRNIEGNLNFDPNRVVDSYTDSLLKANKMHLPVIIFITV